MIRVLIVEDSPTVRMVLRSLLERDPEITVVGEAENGAEGVRRAVELRPDVITMDIHMPGMDGVEATRRIMAEAPTPILVVSSSTRDREVSLAFDAVAAGAASVLEKPAAAAEGLAPIASELVESVRVVAGVSVVTHRRGTRPRAPRGPTEERVVGVAASTGGPAAVHLLLRQLPVDFPAPILVVQHIAPGFASGLKRWLAGASALPVVAALDAAHLAPGTVYVAVDGMHLGVGPRSRVALCDAPAVDGHRPSATHLFRSLAGHWGARAVGVILTGMGRDGLDGLRSLKEAGGTVLAQDEASSVVFGMNGEAVKAGLADEVLPLGDIAGRLARIVGAAP